jgi:hypothetical protein
MTQIIQIGKPAPAASLRDMIQQLAQREADEIRRLKQAMSVRSQH